MSLEENKEQILKLQEKLGALQEEKHQLKKVLPEGEKRRLREHSDLTRLTSAAQQQSLIVHTGTQELPSSACRRAPEDTVAQAPS